MLIDFLTHGVHPFSADHPLYRSLIDNPPEGYSIAEGEYPWWVSSRGTQKQFVFIEDWTVLFGVGGKSAAFDIDGPEVQAKKAWLAQPHVLGIITHMRGSVDDCNRLFGMPEKVFYVPLGLPKHEFNRPPSDKVRFLWTSSHGGAGQEHCYRLRGGKETADSTWNMLAKHPTVFKMTFIGAPNDDRYRTEEEMHYLYSTHDVFVVPSVRVHSIAVARALLYGMPVICSDGWGYGELVPKDAGHFCQGQWGLTCWHDGVFREDYSKMPPVNKQLAINVHRAMECLLDRNNLARMSEATNQASFDIGRRNEILKGILDKHL